jgi:iron-regulated transporter 1
MTTASAVQTPPSAVQRIELKTMSSANSSNSLTDDILVESSSASSSSSTSASDRSVVVSQQTGCWAAVRDATAHEPAIWILFVDYLLSSWSDRMWAFALPVLFVEQLQRQAGVDDTSSTSLLLLPASLYALLSQVACVLFGSAIGAWIDREHRRRVVAILLAVQNGCVVAAAFLFAYITRDDENAPAWHESVEFWLLFALLTLLGAVAALASLGQSVAIKKDWVVVLAHRESTRLATINAVMRGIDLACEILAPMLFSVVLTATDASWSLVFVALWNAVSFFPELFLLLTVYRKAEAILTRNTDAALLADDQLADAERGAAPPTTPARPTPPAMPSFVQRWRIYLSQPVLMSSLSLVLLYFTVLQPGYLLTSYLKSQEVSDISLAAFRGASAIIGLVSTVLVPLLLSRGLPVETLALAAVGMQFLCLLPTLVTVFVPGSPPTVFMVCVALSRFALYSFDLCAIQIMQAGVPETMRGVVNAAESSLTNLASMLGYALGIVSPDPKHFSYLVLVSVASVGTSTICSTIYWRRARQTAHEVGMAKS